MANRQFHHIFEFLRNAGSKNANVNGSVTPVTFEYEAPHDGVSLTRLIIYIQDDVGFFAQTYGGIAQLANGILLQQVDSENNVIVDFLDGDPIQTNHGWAQRCYDYRYDAAQIFGDKSASIRWTWAATGGPIVLKTGDKIRVTIQDNLTTLSEHTFTVQGRSSN